MSSPLCIDGPGYVLGQVDYRETLGVCAEAGGADLVCTSPPYDDARTYDNGVVWTFEDYQQLGNAFPEGTC